MNLISCLRRLGPLAAVLATTPAATSPAVAQVLPERLLEIDGYTVDDYRATATLAQDAQPLLNQRGTGLDGSLRLQAPFGWVVNANPFHEDWNDKAWYLGDIMLNTGRYSPTEIDMALPAPGFRWTVGRTYNIPGDPNNGSERTEGYQGYNWQQFSQPELVYVGGPAGVDYIYIVYGADRYLTFRQLDEESEVFRGINGAAGAVVAGSNGDHDLFVYWDQHGTRSTFFDPRDEDNAITVSPSVYDGRGQLWTIEDVAGNTAYVGHATSPTDAITEGYHPHGGIKTAYDTAGRKYEYTYTDVQSTSGPSQSRVSLTKVEAFVLDGIDWVTTGAKVEYTYAQQQKSNVHLFGDLIDVAVTIPLGGFDPAQPTQLISTTRQQYFYYTSTTHSQYRPHWLRFAISPEGVRLHAAENEGDTPLDDPSLPELYADFEFRYFTDNTSSSLPAHAGKIRNFQYSGSAHDERARTEFYYGDYDTFLSSSTPTYDPGHATFTTVYPQLTVGQVVFAQYFDEAGQPVTRVENMELDAGNCFLAGNTPPYASDLPAKWTYVSRRASEGVDGADGTISLIASPLAVESAAFNPPIGSGYEPPCQVKTATSGTNGQLVHVFPRETNTSEPFWGFRESRSWQNGKDPSEPEDGPFPFEEFDYVAPVENAAAAATVAGEYLVIRPLLESHRIASSVDFAPPAPATGPTITIEETTYEYEFHAEGLGSSTPGVAGDPAWLAPRRVDVTLPAVPTAQFGSGVAATRQNFYRPDGTLVYARDEIGVYSYWQMENGLVVRDIADADLAQTSAFATGEQPPDYLTSVPSTADAHHRVTALTRDQLGRPTEIVFPSGRVRLAHHTALTSGERVSVWSAETDLSTHVGPGEYQAFDHNGNLVVDASIAFGPTGSTTADLDAWVDTTATHPLDSLDVGEWAQISTHVYNSSGRVLWADRLYFEAPLSGDGARSYNYDERLYEYGAELRPTGVAEMNGTLRSVDLDAYGQPEVIHVGSYDPRESVTPPQGSSLGGPHHVPGCRFKPDWEEPCCQEVASFYGISFTEACGDEPVIASDPSAEPAARYIQGSVRGMPVFELELEAPHTFREYDNLGRLVREAVYAAVPAPLSLRNPLPTAADRDDPDIFQDFDDRFHTPRSLSDHRRSLVEYEYNARGQLARVRRYEIDQGGPSDPGGDILTDGAGEKFIETVFAYDAANRLIYVNDGRVTKIKRDRLGREVTRYELASHNDTLTNYTSLTGVSGDIVVRQSQRVYEDASDNLVYEIVVDRITNIDPMGTEPFGSIDENDYSDPSAFSVDPAEIFGRVQITEYAYDTLDRVVSRTLHGTGNTETGSVFDPTTPPPGALTVSLTRDAAGRIVEVEDELGRVQARTYDLAGKLTGTIDNFDSNATGSATDDVNRRTGYEYLHTQLVSYKAYTDPTAPGVFQETTYEWYSDLESTDYDPSRDRVYRITYPDTRTEEFLHHVRGPLLDFKDRSLNHLAVTLDDRFRPREIVVNDIPWGNDFVQSEGDRIELEYDDRGLLKSIAQSRANGAWIHDQVDLTYDGYGALASMSQSQNWFDQELSLSTIGAATHTFGYAWQRSANGGPSRLRLATNTFPDAKVLTYNYTGATNNALSRITNINFDGTTAAVYQYLGVDRPALTTYPENNVFSTLRDSTGAYDALDRFNRPIRSRWNRTRPGGSNQVPFYDTTVHWDAGSNVTGVTDHVFDTDFNFVYANDQLDRLVGSRRGGGDGVSITGLIEQEDWVLSKVGNWENHDLELTGDDPPSYSTDPADGEFQAFADFSDINETTLIGRDRNNDADYLDPGEAITRVYDSNGNLVSDSEKGHAYKWDVLGRLMEIRDGNDDLVAAFRYNALGHRIAEHVDLDGDGDVDADDPWTRLVYDARWRVVATYRIDAVQDTEALHERFIYHAAGLDGVGTGSYIDALVLRDRDADGNGSLEERHYYCQSWRHDVVAIVDHLGRWIESMRYTPYGVPISIPASDKDRNGLLEQADLDLQAAAISLPYDVTFDNDLDGDVDFTDLSLAVNQIGAITDPIGRGVLSSYGHRAGYAGYQWIPAAGLYHVRYRWYDAGNGTWLSKDPAGYVDGASLFGYGPLAPLCGSDPMGLDWLDAVIDFGAGAGDALSLGGTKLLRNRFVGEGRWVDTSSGAYTGGVVTATVAGIAATGGVGAASKTGILVGKTATGMHVGVRAGSQIAHGVRASKGVKTAVHSLDDVANLGFRYIYVPMPFLLSVERGLRFANSGARSRNCVTAAVRIILH